MLTALFDRKFDHLISRQALGVIYAVVVAAHLIVCVIGVVWAATWAVPLAIVIVLAAFIGLLAIRLAFEAITVYFRAAEDLRALRLSAERNPV